MVQSSVAGLSGARWLAGALLSAAFITIQASANLFVDSDWLAERSADPSVVVLEVRYYPHRYYTIGHIPGARQVQRFRDLGDNNGPTLMHFPPREQFQRSLRSWGVNGDSTLVLYDDARTALLSRLYFLLDLYGFDMSRVKILAGGTIEWTAFNELKRSAETVNPGNITLSPARAELMVAWTDVYNDVVSRRDPGIFLLDARPTDQYTGQTINHAVRGGHVPGAINVVSLDGTDAESQIWLDDEALTTVYSKVPREQTIYAYCHDGFRMSLAYMQLKYLGYPDVRLYNGGWGHWGNALSLPVVEGEAPFDENFSL